MNKLINDYKQAQPVEGHMLFAVKMSDAGWSIADGAGILLTLEDEIELAGWHLPISFETMELAVSCIKKSGTCSGMFSLEVAGEWVQHAINSGGTFKPEYEM